MYNTPMHVVIFEGIRWDTFAPLALSRPTFMLQSGMGTLLDKQIRLLNPSRLSLWVRPEMAAYCRKFVVPTLSIPTTVNEPLNDDPTLITTGRTMHMQKFEMPPIPSVVVEDGDLVRFATVEKMSGLSPTDVFARSDRWLKLLELPHTMPQARYVDWVWDLIGWNEESLITDFVHWRGQRTVMDEGPWHLINRQDIAIVKGAKLGPGCVLDASRGPIVIDANASIGANAVIEGPCYIGTYTTILPLTFIRPGTTIGSNCRIAGEVSNSIVSSYTNKSHYGYLGDSFLGSWVNFGAGTTTSNLKNTYGEVKMKIGGKEYATGRRNLGSIVGDHSKTAIGTRLNTGTYVGFCSQVAGAGLTPKFIPSFSFWTTGKQETYDLAKAIEVAKKVYARRDREWTDQDTQLMHYAKAASARIEA